jgi:hypothetical protein
MAIESRARVKSVGRAAILHSVIMGLFLNHNATLCKDSLGSTTATTILSKGFYKSITITNQKGLLGHSGCSSVRLAKRWQYGTKMFIFIKPFKGKSFF